MKSLLSFLSVAAVAGSLMVPALPAGSSAGGAAAYAVTITNLTQAQIISPPLLVTHGPSASLFRAGEPASPELAELAENGDNGPLAQLLAGDAAVIDVLAADEGLPPGTSASFTVGSLGRRTRLSAAGMLVSTNDAFFGLGGVELPASGSVTLDVPAYDAGSERNSEDCAYVPGPPCGAGAVHDPAPAEGFVHISNGLHGIGGIDPATYDWRNPVVRIQITRL